MISCSILFHTFFIFARVCLHFSTNTRLNSIYVYFRVHFLHCYNKRKEMFSHYHKIILPHGQLLPHTFYEYCSCPITIHSIHSFLKLINMLYQLYWLVKRKKYSLWKIFELRWPFKLRLQISSIYFSGENATITCKVESVPQSHIRWYSMEGSNEVLNMSITNRGQQR